MGQRFLNCCERFSGHFRRRTRTVAASARHDVRGLLQAETRNRERMEAATPEADDHALRHRLSESAWSGRAVRDQAAGLPKAQRGFQRKTDLALAMIVHAR